LSTVDETWQKVSPQEGRREVLRHIWGNSGKPGTGWHVPHQEETQKKGTETTLSSAKRCTWGKGEKKLGIPQELKLR